MVYINSGGAAATGTAASPKQAMKPGEWPVQPVRRQARRVGKPADFGGGIGGPGGAGATGGTLGGAVGGQGVIGVRLEGLTGVRSTRLPATPALRASKIPIPAQHRAARKSPGRDKVQWMLPLLLFLFAAPFAHAADSDWGALSFLIGNWTGDGGGQPGKGAGEFSFREDLQGKVLVRRSFAEYPAAQGRPAYRHDDLMIVYREAGATRAVFFDNEGHVIHYAVTAAGDSVQFLSEPTEAAARFRFTYRRTGPAAVSMKFEIAPPGKPEAFTTYLEGTARKR